ncbi:TetR/AcrR family transcriptional regulator [Streptomyces sp. TRM 70361]|uniref:TetR/AcrR family transcriptional regulator n=1 Tax=Streptomyces sp. TRM 70361 TaxID=3116553 RepID=UPI002E7AC5BC|nr:TetR/AcrR family transcriptional regulator [Streptomyces sp. TRM 70361]MEE1942131.1 TetR/AcrR family transcriptional regulator [Streptomyces sp. TRM 70361]
MRTDGTGKSGYHHGDLRNALIEAATELARAGGPEAVVLRAAARRVGVSPTAAYRHFTGQGDLLRAVKARGQRWLADTMEEVAGELARDAGGAGAAAEERIRAMGLGYLRFALAEPGLFRAAFCRLPLPEEEEGREGEARGEVAGGGAGGAGGFGPDGPRDARAASAYGLLGEALDALAATGRMPAGRRPGAEFAAWSAVHGLAVLILDGPLSRLPGEQRDAVVEGVLASVLRGLTAPA